MSKATTNENPFAYAIAVTGPGLHRAHWLSGNNVTGSRIHASCWPNKELAQKYCTAVAALNEEYKFQVRKFSS